MKLVDTVKITVMVNIFQHEVDGELKYFLSTQGGKESFELHDSIEEAREDAEDNLS